MPGKPFTKPHSTLWNATVAAADVPTLLRGFTPRDMDDKWVVYIDRPDPEGMPDGEGVATVHIHRSWTGIKWAELKVIVALDESGKPAEKDAVVRQITWEAGSHLHGVESGSNEEDAKTVAKNVSWYVMGFRLNVPSD